MKQKRNYQRERWLREFEEKAVTAGVYQPGRVDWDTAIYLYNTCGSVDEAVAKLTEKVRG